MLREAARRLDLPEHAPQLYQAASRLGLPDYAPMLHEAARKLDLRNTAPQLNEVAESLDRTTDRLLRAMQNIESMAGGGPAEIEQVFIPKIPTVYWKAALIGWAGWLVVGLLIYFKIIKGNG